MSHQFTTEQLHKRYDSLPEDIRAAVSSREVAELLEAIGRQYKLRIDKTGLLIEQTTLIMLGFIKSHEFVNNLTRELEITKEQAEAIAVAVDEKVFARIRTSLREVQTQSTSDARFEESSDYGNNPARDSLLADVEKQALVDTPTVNTVQESMSNADYQAESFLGNKPSTQTPPQATPSPIVQGQPEQTAPPLETPTTPAPPAHDDDFTKDFKQKLAEKLQSTPQAVNADPYKESIE